MSSRKQSKKQKYSILLFVFFISLVFTNSIITNAYVKTIVHEFGCAVGLAHTQPSNNLISVMREFNYNGKPYPLSDDKKGIATIY